MGSARPDTVDGRLPIPASTFGQNTAKSFGVSRLSPTIRANGPVVLSTGVEHLADRLGRFFITFESGIKLVEQESGPARIDLPKQHGRRCAVHLPRVAYQKLEHLKQQTLPALRRRASHIQVWRPRRGFERVGVSNPQGDHRGLRRRENDKPPEKALDVSEDLRAFSSVLEKLDHGLLAGLNMTQRMRQ